MQDIEITYEKMSELILAGAEILEFQNFLGVPKQIFRTRAASEGVTYVSYHDRPMKFILQPGGKIVTDEQLEKLNSKKPSTYHPS